jgi:methionyl-tRNA formyltransferase
MALTARLLERVSSLVVVHEVATHLPGSSESALMRSPVMTAYFERVRAAEEAVFGPPSFRRSDYRQLILSYGDLSKLDTAVLKEALDADLLLVFGGSFIRPPLVDLLMDRHCVNIHLGVSPYYRGTATNFWSLYDGRPDLVGATVHLLSRDLDAGPILFHALPPSEPTDPFLLGMRAAESAFGAVVERLIDNGPYRLEPVAQDRALEIRYARNADFTPEVAAEYLARVPTQDQVGAALAGRDLSQFVHPYVEGR